MSRRFLQSLLLCSTASAPLVTAATMLSVVFAFPVAAQDEETADEVSMEPVLIVPDDLIADALIEEAGDAVSERISPQLQTLYDLDLTPAERLQAVSELRAAIPGLPTASLRNRVARRVDLLDAGLRALQVSPAPSEDQQKLVMDLITAANAFEGQQLSTNSATVRENYRVLRSSAPQIYSILRPVMMRHYFNHNLHLTVSETILSQFATDFQSKSGRIADCILGAWVTGSQVTNVNITADVKPSSGNASFNILADGQTHSNTAGTKHPATIYTRGNHYFHMVAPVTFTGDTLFAGPTTINVNANNQTVGVRTEFDGIPIIRGIVRKIALRKAAELKGQSEAIAARKLASQAVPEFQAELNQRFAEANTQIQTELLQGLRNKGVAPDSISARSSESHMAISSRTLGTARLSGSAQPFSPLPYRGAAVQVHETAINNGIDGLNFEGRDVPEDELDRELERSLSELLQRDISFSNINSQVVEQTDADEPPATFLFSDSDPIRFRFDAGKVVLMLRMGIRQEGKDDIPEHHIEVPIDVTLQNGKLLLTPPAEARDIKVAPLGRKSLRLVAQAAQIRRLLTARLPSRELDPVVSLKMSDTKRMNLRLIDIQIADGWLSTEFQ